MAVATEQTATDPHAMSGPTSREVWEEVLRRLERDSVLVRAISDDELAQIVRDLVADCVRDAIRAEASTIGGRGAPTGSAVRGEDPSGSFFVDREQPPALERIGGYLVVRELGAGGFGKVYLCVSDDDLKLPVAVKVLHDAGDEQGRRFVAERSILANLRHPNIARFESSGILPDGRPWLAMEYIEGLPLLGYCDRERLSTAARLVLFQKICEAVHEAHKWGVVHLDIKPSNIMVTLEGEPKLLDFGIAKIVRSLDPTMRTTAARDALTYLYSSPEQLRHEPVSTASDVYNLGLVLYELLTGSRARQSAAKEIDQFVREVLSREPELPSLRVEQTGRPPAGNVPGLGTTTTSAALSQGGPSRLARKLRGDLDTIVMMAMRVEPSRRYSSAKELAEDVGRHLARLPIMARKQSVGYRLGMQLERHRHAVVAAFLLLVATVAVSAAVWSERERRVQAERDRYKEQIVAMERDARASRRDIERERDRRLGWVRFDLDADPEVRDLLESRVDDERRVFDLLLKFIETDPTRSIGVEQVRDLLEPELKLVALQRRSRSPAELSEAVRALEALETRIARVPAGALDEVDSVSVRARILETRGELLGPRTTEGKREFDQALALRARLIELRGSDTQSRYDYAKLLARFCEGAVADGDGPGAVKIAEEMLAMRETILAEERRLGDAEVIDRRERDLAVASYWLARAALEASDLALAERASDECQRIMAERFARPDRRMPEAEVDLARAFDDRLTVALRSGDEEVAWQASADAGRHALSAAIRSIEQAPELQQTLDFIARRAQLLLSDASEDSALEAEAFVRAAIEQLENAHTANPRSVLRSNTGIGDRFERLQLLQSAAQSVQGRTADAVLAIAELGLAKTSPQELQSAAKRRSVWIVGLVQCRDSLSRGRADDARAWAAFAARAATARGSALEAKVCLEALEAIARGHPGVIGDRDGPQLAELRKLGTGAVAPQARAAPHAPPGRGTASTSGGA